MLAFQTRARIAGSSSFKFHGPHGPRKIMVKKDHEDPKRESFAFVIGFTVGVLHAVMKHTFAALFKRL